MKTLAFNDDAGLTVSYLTDRIDEHDLFTVYQIHTSKDGVITIGATQEVIEKKYFLDLALYYRKQFVDFANINQINLIETSEEVPYPVYLVDNRQDTYWSTRFPSNLLLNVISDTQVDLAWTNNGTEDYDGGIIERTEDEGVTWTAIWAFTTGDTTYSDTSIVVYTEYSYRIRYCKGTHYSPYSDEVDITDATWVAYWGQFWVILKSGDIWYRREINRAGGYFILWYSSNAGSTWEELMSIDLTEDSVIIDLVHAYHHRVVGTEYRVDNFLTALGYTGIEGIDWENLYST